MTRPCKCGECAFFKNEDANGYGHCIITLNQYRCDDLCKFKEDHMSDEETLRALHHYQKWRRGGICGSTVHYTGLRWMLFLLLGVFGCLSTDSDYPALSGRVLLHLL